MVFCDDVSDSTIITSPITRTIPPKCRRKFPTSRTSSRSAAARMLPVRLFMPNKQDKEMACDHMGNHGGTWKRKRGNIVIEPQRENTFCAQPLTVSCYYSRAHKEEQAQPDQVQGPLPPSPLHPRPQGLGQGREAQAVASSRYAISLLYPEYWMNSRKANSRVQDSPSPIPRRRTPRASASLSPRRRCGIR